MRRLIRWLRRPGASPAYREAFRRVRDANMAGLRPGMLIFSEKEY